MKTAALVFAVMLCATGLALGQNRNFSVTDVFDALDEFAEQEEFDNALATPWWDQHVANSQRKVPPVSIDVQSLMYLAVQNSNQIKIAACEPQIQRFAIEEANSAFDWNRFVNTTWDDLSQPVSTSLIVGNSGNRLEDHNYRGMAGVGRRLRNGGQLSMQQGFGWQQNNSQFFLNGAQSTSQFVVSMNQPLMRGRGRFNNERLIMLAQINTQIAEEDFFAALQDHLFEIGRAYWNVYLERAILAQQVKLFLNTYEIYEWLEKRQDLDAQKSQLVMVSSALQTRRADLIRAKTAVTNAETRLRGLVNANELYTADVAELIPMQFPSHDYFQTDLQSEIQIALQNRPEIKAAIQHVKAASERLGIAKHEMMPMMNVITQMNLNGLVPNFNFFADSFGDQFSGTPSYTVGLQYEAAIGNRQARMRRNRLNVELERIKLSYEQAIDTVTTEVDIAVREFNTTYREIRAKGLALQAAETEAETILKRWEGMADGDGTASLNLEALLRAQERVTEAEREYATSVLTYNLAVLNLKKTNGTLLQSEQVPLEHLGYENPSNVLGVVDKGNNESELITIRNQP